MSLRAGILRAGKRASSPLATALPTPPYLYHVQRWQLQQKHAQCRQVWSFFQKPPSPSGGNSGAAGAPPTPSPTALSASAPATGDGEHDALIHRFNNAVWTNDVAGLFRHYNTLRVIASTRSQASPLLSRQELLDALSMLASTASAAHSQNLPFIDSILADMPALFRTPVTEDVHRAVLTSLLRPRAPLEPPYKWLMSMQRKPGHVPPTLALWHLFLRQCAERQSLSMLRRAVQDMPGTGCRPTPTTYHILLNAMHDAPTPPPVMDMLGIIDEMHAAGFTYDPVTLSTMCDGYASRDMDAEVRQIESTYQARFVGDAASSATATGSDPALEELAAIASSRGVRSALSIFQSWDMAPSVEVIAALLRGSHKASDLALVERETGLRVGAFEPVWRALIRNAVVYGLSRNATELYDLALRAGVPPNAAMADSVIHTLCFSSNSLRGPTDRALDQALSIYRELCATSVAGSPDSEVAARAAPTRSIYHNLLRALASSGNTTKYLPEVTSLVEDMSARGVEMDSTVLTLAVVASMRAARSHAEAFRAYESLTQGATPLDAMGFHRVMDTYAKLSPKRGTLPSPREYFAIARDMRAAGHALTPAVYTIFLQHLATSASRVIASRDSDARDALLATLRRTHERLSVDAGLSPDAHLWNTLMDAYQRAGAPGDALRVWDAMLRRGRADSASVSIVLDACAHSGDYRLLEETWRGLREKNFPLNQRNWNNYVEALCRLGRVQEATKIVCEDMVGEAQKQGGTIAPTKDALGILVKFARSYDQEEEVREQLKTRLPDLWETLPEDLRV